MGFPENVLAKSERVERKLHPHWLTVVVPTIFGAAPRGGLHRRRRRDSRRRAPATGSSGSRVAVFVLVAVPAVVVPYLRWRTTHYVVTSHRVMVRRGILTKNGKDITLSKITDVSFQQTLSTGSSARARCTSSRPATALTRTSPTSRAATRCSSSSTASSTRTTCAAEVGSVTSRGRRARRPVRAVTTATPTSRRRCAPSDPSDPRATGAGRGAPPGRREPREPRDLSGAGDSTSPRGDPASWHSRLMTTSGSTTSVTDLYRASRDQLLDLRGEHARAVAEFRFPEWGPGGTGPSTGSTPSPVTTTSPASPS